MIQVLKLQMLNPQSSKSELGDMLISSFSGVCPIGLENGPQYQSTAP